MLYSRSRHEFAGFGYGFLGILIFSLTLPATRIAVLELDPVFVGLGRAVVAAILSLILLIVTRQKLPPWRFLPRFIMTIAGVVIGFPVLSAIAMRNAPASYGAVIIGLLPLATAFWGVWRGKEKVSMTFWIFALLGSGLVICFALISGARSITFVDLALFGAVVAGGIGYAEGGILARSFGSWQVICWSLVLSLPVLLPIVIEHSPTSLDSISLNVWLGFLYVSVFSMFLGFIAWYRGLSIGGIARVSQIQLIQPFLTILASAILLDESLTFTTLGFALGVIICVVLSKRVLTSKLQKKIKLKT
ncbi:DMT family transporter [Myxosarcina sp. GI1]|uniref:DMT family transporter n=1 Tax=Myxosarcina sp. GI1 TaxID=1541065 RepID=UPI00055F5C7D|nr:DMT family transporter [Myxosarcina sp. GI1]